MLAFGWEGAFGVWLERKGWRHICLFILELKSTFEVRRLCEVMK